jgi:hypothetical protein
VRRARRAVLALAIAAAVLPYVAVVGDYFVQDDFGVVSLLSDKPWSSFPRWFVTTWMDDIWGYTPDEIRPFPALSYQVAALWGAASPVANHAINIAFHAVNTLLVFGIGRTAAGLGLAGSLAAAVIFAVLPMQAESVAWITGRVDSMPACFYMASFLLFVRWRTSGGTGRYATSVICCFLALFSKQNTITLPAALVMYDVMVRRDWPRVRWHWVGPYLPYVVLTVGYLALRGVVFGEVAREGMLTAERLSVAVSDLSTHLRRMIYGPDGLSIAPVAALLAVCGAFVLVSLLAWWKRCDEPGARLRAAAYFLIVWVALGAAPTLVAGYASPRHMYLASAGWALGVAVAAEALTSASARWLQWTARAAVLAIVLAYLAQLQSVVRDWHVRATVSRRAVADIEREVLAAPEGSLVLAGAPRGSWDFAVPHALRPPFTATDLTERASIITHSSLHCCPADRWDPHTRQLLREFRARPDRPPVIALYWDPVTGELSRLTDAEDPDLRFLAEILPDTGERASLDEAILDTFTELVLPRARSAR